MTIYAMDRSYYDLKEYENAFSKTKQHLQCFTNLFTLTEAIDTKQPDIVLLDSGIPSLIPFVLKMRKQLIDTKFIFVSNTDGLSAELLDLQPDGWIVKPVTKDKVKQQLLHLSRQNSASAHKRKKEK